MTSCKLCLLVFALTSSVSTTDVAVENIIDLGHDLFDGAPNFPFPGLEPFHHEIIERAFNEYGWKARSKFTVTSFVGTEFQAPYINYINGWKVDEVPLENLFADISVIDVTEKVEQDHTYAVTSEDVEEWIAENGLFPNNSVILFRTGWSSRYDDPEAYYGKDGQLEFPGISEEAVRTILRLMRSNGITIVGMGMDGPCSDVTFQNRYLVHQLLGAANVYMLQNLKNLEQLPIVGARIMVMPTLFRGASTAPARVMAQLKFYE